MSGAIAAPCLPGWSVPRIFKGEIRVNECGVEFQGALINSPINGMDNLKTPLLVAFGDKDGAVDFSQGVELYNAARRAEKDNFVMLVYPGENHGLRREENMVDYHHRILERLAH